MWKRCNQMIQEISLGSGRSKTMISEAVLQALEANLVSGTRRLSGELRIS